MFISEDLEGKLREFSFLYPALLGLRAKTDLGAPVANVLLAT